MGRDRPGERIVALSSGLVPAVRACGSAIERVARHRRPDRSIVGYALHGAGFALSAMVVTAVFALTEPD